MRVKVDIAQIKGSEVEAIGLAAGIKVTMARQVC